jgi:hypothetical protein
VSLKRLIVTVTAAAVATASGAAPASAANGDAVKCTKTFCIAVFHKTTGRTTFDFATDRMKGRYRLCVTPAKRRKETCKFFHLRPRQDKGPTGNPVQQSIVDFRRNFPHPTRGMYRVRWFHSGKQVGPTLEWRV